MEIWYEWNYYYQSNGKIFCEKTVNEVNAQAKSWGY